MSTPSFKSKGWNHTPDLPLTQMPYWFWPPQPWSIISWLIVNFLQVSNRALFLLYSFAIAFWLMPFVPTEAVLGWDWAALVLLRNMIAVFLVVGGLHIWFYGIDGQGNILRFDTRPITGRKNMLFLFKCQTWDNIFHTLVLGVPVATVFEIAVRWVYASGFTVPAKFAESPVWFILLFPVLTIIQALHFYLIHRLLHWPPLVHSVHHRNVNVGPWSGLLMHPFEHFLYFSSLSIFLFLPAHPVHMIFLLHWQLLGAPTGHSAYEALFAKNKARTLIGGFFHQLHHRYYECNYGSPEFLLDKWFGTYNDGTEKMTMKICERKRRMHAK